MDCNRLDAGNPACRAGIKKHILEEFGRVIKIDCYIKSELDDKDPGNQIRKIV